MSEKDGSEPVKRFATVVGLVVAIRTAFRSAIGRERPRPGALDDDFDPSERKVPANRRAETIVAVLLLLAAVCGFGFTALYVVLQTNTQLLGLAIGGML